MQCGAQCWSPQKQGLDLDRGQVLVLEDPRGQVLVFEDPRGQFWSPWSWPWESSPWPWPRDSSPWKYSRTLFTNHCMFLHKWLQGQQLRIFSSRTPTLVNIELNVSVKYRILYTFTQ